MRRKLEEILSDAHKASAEEIQLVIDELENVKSKLKEIRLKKLEDSLYEKDENEPWWNK